MQFKSIIPTVLLAALSASTSVSAAPVQNSARLVLPPSFTDPCSNSVSPSCLGLPPPPPLPAIERLFQRSDEHSARVVLPPSFTDPCANSASPACRGALPVDPSIVDKFLGSFGARTNERRQSSPQHVAEAIKSALASLFD